MEIPAYIVAQFKKPEAASRVSTYFTGETPVGTLAEQLAAMNIDPERKAVAIERFRKAAITLPSKGDRNARYLRLLGNIGPPPPASGRRP